MLTEKGRKAFSGVHGNVLYINRGLGLHVKNLWNDTLKIWAFIVNFTLKILNIELN